MVIFNDYKVLDEVERGQLKGLVEGTERDILAGEYASIEERMLVRAAEHIGVQDQRIANLSRAYQVTEKDNDRLRAGLEKMVLAVDNRDADRAVQDIEDVLKELGFDV